MTPNLSTREMFGVMTSDPRKVPVAILPTTGLPTPVGVQSSGRPGEGRIRNSVTREAVSTPKDPNPSVEKTEWKRQK